jgi:hypothetical protein
MRSLNRAMALSSICTAIGISISCGPQMPMSVWVPLVTSQLSVPLDSNTVVELRREGHGIERINASQLRTEELLSWKAMARPADDSQSLGRAIELCKRVGIEYAAETDEHDTEAPNERVNCQVVANRLYALLRETDIPSRRVDLAVRPGSPYEGHSAVEIWSTESQRWALLDPFFCIWYSIDGRPASALDLHYAVTGGTRSVIRMERIGDGIGVDPWTNRIPPLLYFRTLLLSMNDGAWLVYADPDAKIGYIADPAFVWTESTSAFLAPPDQPVALTHAREVRAGSIVIQTFRGRLYVGIPKLSEPNTWWVRVPEGQDLALEPIPAAYDVRDQLLSRKDELLPLPPNAWSIQGTPTSVVRDEHGGITIETNAETVQLACDFESEQGASLVIAAHIRNERGSVNFEIGGRRKQFVLELDKATDVSISPVIVKARGRDSIIITVAPESRCHVFSVNARHTRSLSDFLDPHR